MNADKFSWRKRARSFIYAWSGVRMLVSGEHNARLHLVAAVAAVSLGLVFDIDRGEWLAIVICIGSVLMAEGFNSAIEAVCDLVSPDHHPLVKRAKDIAAGAVLVMAAAALACGCIIFLPRLMALFS